MGQNLGTCLPSSASQPQRAHLRLCAAGRGLPHSLQNFPVFFIPQEQIHSSLAAGLFLPHSPQNFPVFFFAPQTQSQASSKEGDPARSCRRSRFSRSISYRLRASIPPACAARFIPANAIMEPAVLEAAALMASACAPDSAAAAMPLSLIHI